MAVLLVCASSHHGNTLRVAERIAVPLGAHVVTPADVSPADLDGVDVVGFGSGVYWMSFAPALTGLVRSLQPAPRGAAFVFATSGMPETPLRRYTRSLANLLADKGFRVQDELFHCRGLDTMGPLGLVGGMNKGRPDAADLDGAEAFGRGLARRLL